MEYELEMFILDNKYAEIEEISEKMAKNAKIKHICTILRLFNTHKKQNNPFIQQLTLFLSLQERKYQKYTIHTTRREDHSAA